MPTTAQPNVDAKPAPSAQAGKTELLQLVSFTAGGKAYALPILVVQEINRTMPVEHPASCPTFLEGRVNLRGQSIPLIDFGKRMTSTPCGKSAEARVIFVEVAGNQSFTLVGLAVDKVSRVLRMDAGTVHPAEPDAQHAAIRGVGKLGEEELILLYPDQLLNADELAQLGRAA